MQQEPDVFQQQLGISRHTVREALKNLAALGVVEIIHGSGAYLKEQDFDFLSFPMQMALGQGRRAIEDLIETRELVEIQVIRLACERASDDQLSLLDQFLTYRATAEGLEEYRSHYDFEFEGILGEICGNRYLASIQRLTHILWEDALSGLGVSPIDVRVINEEHAKIVQAVRARDVQRARAAMLYHLKSALRGYNENKNREK
ncbi:MAG: FCD domain-containing protein [Clostridia bacterium]|nr:FCD domain-containing protein [Clostridia bacterium]